MATTHTRASEPIPANRVLAASGGSWPKALARALKAPVKEQSQPEPADDLPGYSLFVPAGFAPRRR